MDKNRFLDFKINFNNKLDAETKIKLFKFYQNNSTKDVLELIVWMVKENPNLLFGHRDFIVPRLLEFKHFEVVDKLLKDKAIYFDNDLAKHCSFNLALHFDSDVFDYVMQKIETSEKRFQMVKDFWSEFLNFQFQRDDEVDGNLNNLKYVIDKIPFYEKSSYDMKNGSLIKMRSKFFTKDINDLQEKNKEKILVLLGSLLGENYFLFEESIQEEFKNFLLVIDKFNLFKEKKELQDSIKNAVSERKIKV